METTVVSFGGLFVMVYTPSSLREGARFPSAEEWTRPIGPVNPSSLYPQLFEKLLFSFGLSGIRLCLWGILILL